MIPQNNKDTIPDEISLAVHYSPALSIFVVFEWGSEIGQRRTAHAETVGKEITGIGHERDQTTLDVRVAGQVRMLETERTA